MSTGAHREVPSGGPLEGLVVEAPGASGPGGVAGWLLAGLGARPATSRVGGDAPAGAQEVVLREPGGASSRGTFGRGTFGGGTSGRGRLIRAAEPLPAAGLPLGTLDYAAGLALAAATVAALWAGTTVEVDEVAVAVQVRLPEVMAAAYGSPVSLAPGPPRPAPGGGWVQADLGAPGAEEDFGYVLTAAGPDADAATLAAAAQEWRLAVCDYRPPTAHPAVHPVGVEMAGPSAAAPSEAAPSAAAPSTGAGPDSRPAPGRERRPGRRGPLSGVTVIDLTAMWAGPLATGILAGLGAEVIKAEPAGRPDGMRALDGRGIHPGGVSADPGRDSAMWNALNHGKTVVDWDLRREVDLDRLTGRLPVSDLLVESFSPRVMPNLGLDRRLGTGRPAWVAMPAFPTGSRRDWVAYGPGIHAVSGLGWSAAGGRPWGAAVSYPDPLNGLAGALAALAALVGRDRGRPVGRAETSLFATAALLRHWPGATGAAPLDPAAGPGAGRDLLARAGDRGLMEYREVAGRPRPHPRPLLRPVSTG